MYAAKRPLMRPAILLFIVASWFLVACGGEISNASWPGLSAAGNRVYVAYGPQVLAYDAVEQEQAWSFPTERGQAQFFAAPSVEDGHIVFGDYGASGGFFSPGVVVTIYAVNEESQGAPTTLWTQRDLASDRVVAPALQVGEQVFVGTADNRLLALDAETGELEWSFETGHSIWAQPAYKDGILYIASLDKTVYALEADSGNEVWQTRLSGAVASQPLVDTDLIYVASFDRHVHALDINTGEERWAAEAEDWIWGTPVLADGVVYFVDARGNVFAVDAVSGSELWRQALEETVQTSPVVSDGTIYIASQGRAANAQQDVAQGALIALSAENGDELWRQATPATLHTTPVIVDDLIVVALQSESALLIAFDRVTGAQRWTYLPPS